MNIITQDYIGRHIVYHHKFLDSSGRPVMEELYDCAIRTVVEKEVRKILVLDGNGRVRPDPTRYLNDIRMSLPFASRRQAASALSLFYLFCDIKHYNPSWLTFEMVDEFMNFAAGYSVYDEPGSHPHLIRTPKTVNGYYGMIKRFISTMGWPMAAYSHYRETRVFGPAGSEFFTERTARKDVHTLKEGTIADREAPKHITPEQMKQMAALMAEEHDYTALLVAHLQYCYGLRSGEALGLTEEDIITETSDDGPRYKLILRNRLTDRYDQSCKNLIHPASLQGYKKSNYVRNHHEIDITEATYRQIMSYQQYVQKVLLKTRRQKDNYLSDTVADVVEGVIPCNRYLFVGRNGKRLSGQTWNNRLGAYFLRIGLRVDAGSGSKHSNCSHRLRHGFAMYHAQYSSTPMNIMELQRALRHASPTTCAIYYTPLPETERALKESFQKEIENLIPEFTYAAKA